jgi:hypothetical protein
VGPQLSREQAEELIKQVAVVVEEELDELVASVKLIKNS